MQSRIAITAAAFVALAVSSSASATTLEEVQNTVTNSLLGVSENDTQRGMARAVGKLCPAGLIDPNVTLGNDLQQLCNEVVGGSFSSNPLASDGLQAFGNEEDAVIASTEIDSGNAQVDSIGNRQYALRSGTAAVGGGLTYNGSGFTWSGGAAGDEMGNRWGFFVTGLYASSDRDTTQRESGFDADDFGVTAGIDYAMSDQFIIGAAFGYKNSDADIDQRGGNLDTDSYSFFGYFSYYPSEYWYFDAMLGYTDNDHEQERNTIYTIGGPGTGLGATSRTITNTALSDTDSDELSFSGTIGYNIFASGFTVSPYVRFDYADIDIDGFTERMRDTVNAGNGTGLALAVNDQEFESIMLSIGGEFGTEWQAGGTTLYPVFTAEYVHEFDNDNQPITGVFVDDPTRTQFIILTDAPDENFFNIGVGMTAVVTDSLVGFARYQGLFGYDDLDVHAFEFGFRASF